MFFCRIENKHNFYSTLCEWWVSWNFPVMSINALPENIFVVSNDGVDLYSIPVYLSDSNVCWMGFITGNKDSTKIMRKGSLDCLIKFTESYLDELGYEFVMTVSKNPVLKKIFEDNGYFISGENVNEYIKKI